MATYYAYGDALVSKDELLSKVAEGKLQEFEKTLIGGLKDAKLEFLFGTATSDNVLRSIESEDGTPPIGFEPIGIGKPLTVQIRHIYCGNKAEGFWGTKEMLVASAMKSISTYDAAPRAVNFLEKKAKLKNTRNFRRVDATSPGTPLIYYSPALAQSSSVVTVEVIFSGFPKETFEAVGTAFTAAAGIPVFAPASGYLVAAGMVTKLLGKIGKSLFDGTPALSQTEEITFTTPGTETAMARFALLIPDGVPSSVLQNYKINSNGALALVSNENQLYAGDYPYAVISLDGRENDEFKKFAPAAATAALLDKFYNINDGNSQPLGPLIDALQLYNDMKFRDKATAAAEKLKAMDKNSAQYKTLFTQYNAYLTNIGTKELKPPALSE